MIYSGSLIKLNGITFNNIISYKVARNKLWSSDTGRNMAGSMKGTLVGTFPKLILEIEPLSQEEMATLENILDLPSFSVQYYNNKYQCLCTGDFYANDYEEELMRKSDMQYKSFTINLISNEREEVHVKHR